MNKHFTQASNLSLLVVLIWHELLAVSLMEVLLLICSCVGFSCEKS